MVGSAKEQVGIVGVGRMGQQIVRHLVKHGYTVIGCDVDAQCREAAKAAGATVVADPAAVGKAAKVVIVAVGYDHEASAVVLDNNGLLQTMGPGSVIAMSATCTSDHVKMLAEKATAKGVDVLDAPICRGAQAAVAGTMLSLMGGNQAVYDRCLPVFSTFCSDIRLLGDIGAGQLGKALNNYLLWVNGIALIEAAKLSEANGVELTKLREALLLSSGASDALKNWDNVSFLWALKDMQIVSRMADSAGLSLPIVGAIKELVKEGRRIKTTNPPDWTGTGAKAHQ